MSRSGSRGRPLRSDENKNGSQRLADRTAGAIPWTVTENGDCQAACSQVVQVQLAQAHEEQLSLQSAQEHVAWVQVAQVQSAQEQDAHVSEQEAHAQVAHSS